LKPSKKQRGKSTARHASAQSAVAAIQPRGSSNQRKPGKANLHSSKAVRYTFNAIGILSLVVGIIGIVTPVLPTTPFILLSGYCFARGSERLHNWILSHRYFGPMIISFREERRIPLKIKIFASLMIAVSMSITAFFIVPLLAVKIGMGIVGVAVIVYIWSFRN
jgi:uncharacterized membrane protein YbaN (DUF454 family)